MAATNITDHGIPYQRFEPYEFLETQPALYIILVTILVFASVVGTCGNVLILIAIATQRDLQNVESVFIVNLACCDLYVTAIADPLSIVGKSAVPCFMHAVMYSYVCAGGRWIKHVMFISSERFFGPFFANINRQSSLLSL